MLCAISGEAPQVPIASRKSGAVYEKRLIEAYISENGTEPVTGETLTADDLIELKTSRIIRPRPPTLTSIPSLLSVFQEEWDALALETYALRENLVKTRQELSTALYQHDAAIRVIARLTRERDEAREALSKVDVAHRGATTNGDAMHVDSVPLPEEVAAKVDATQANLSKTRRKRPVPADWATDEDITHYNRLKPSTPFHSGGTTLSVHEDGNQILVGGDNGKAIIYSLEAEQVVQELEVGHGSVTSGTWVDSQTVVATSVGTVHMFDGNKELISFHNHAGAVSTVALHPSREIMATVGLDKSYVLYDLVSMSTLTQIYTNSPLFCAQFHPDGHLLAAGAADGDIKIFDVKSGSQAASFGLGAPLKTLYFSENGTWLAALTQGSTSVSIWDLRKAAEIRSLDIGSTLYAISWDWTGQYLLAAGAGGVVVEQYSKSTKEWNEVLRSATPAVAVAWGRAAQRIFLLDNEGSLTLLAGSKEGVV